MQRSGTTSVGKFLGDFGCRPAGWEADRKNGWSLKWLYGDFEKIFNSDDFLNANAYEDSPWFFPELYKMLFYRFPGSRFILIRRNPDRWFASMQSHSNGNIIGWSNVHCKIYRRELDYLSMGKINNINISEENSLKEKKFLKLDGLDKHYKEIYNIHYKEALAFFQEISPDSLFTGKLEDPNLWVNMGKFFNIVVPTGYIAHENRSENIKIKNII